MRGVSRRSIEGKIKDCRQIIKPKEVISCLEELLMATNDGMVAYELGHEYEKIGNKKNAIECYERAESLFELAIYKNMARAAINNLAIEAIITAKKGKRKSSK